MAATVTPEMRQMGWNIHFLDSTGQRFAGVYNHGDLTVGDIWRELQLCFVLPPPPPSDSESWEPALLLECTDDTPAGMAGPGPIELGQNSSTLSSLVLRMPAKEEVDSYHYIYHSSPSCIGPAWADHLEAPCVRRVATPSRRSDPRYLPPNRTSTDQRIAVYPTRRRAKAVSPSKRSASGSPVASRSRSPTKEDEDDLFDNLMFPECAISVDEARQEIAKFRQRCMTGGDCCAISGLGRSWCKNPPIGPAIQAAHIVPQIHFHLFPKDRDQTIPDADDNSELRLAWYSTWSISNGILLTSHIHQLFDARLISIHPKTFRIRVFVPYDILTPYHGRTATLDKKNLPNRNALQHHWDMCCIENMAAMARVPIRPLASSQVVLPRAQQQVLDPSPGSGGNDDHGGMGSQTYGDPQKRSSQSTSRLAQGLEGGNMDAQALTPPLSEQDTKSFSEAVGKRTLYTSVGSDGNDEDRSPRYDEGASDLEDAPRGRPVKRRRCTATKLEVDRD
ncbi:hypothetical protein QBC47DRAFT_129278 [Echria macrotheca]|uniref:HNH nuclease domain-containing protein n=1 Tax=Echria macrotheca TaxID=438768 RepID=A0AAJ0B1D9_9PEZI|nr:hypothetical protein QBC47DRAFT_129278 [Echria macrotheca]